MANALQEFGRAVGGALAAAAAAISPNDSVPPRPVPAVIMPETTPLPRPRPDATIAAAPAAAPANLVAPAGVIGEPVAAEPPPAAVAAVPPEQIAVPGIPIPTPRPDGPGAEAGGVAEGDAMVSGGEMIAADPPPAELVAPPAGPVGQFAFAGPERTLTDPAPFAVLNGAGPAGGAGAPPAVVAPGEDHRDGLGVAPAEAGDAEIGALLVPSGNRIAGPGDEPPGDVVVPVPRSRPSGVQVAALPQSTPALIARLNDNPPDPACIGRLQELGVEFEILERIITDTGCGTSQPLLVRALREGAVQLDPPATLDCAMAERLVAWMDEEVQPAAAQEFEARVTGLRVAASYSCRGVNGATSGPLSEHAYGNAIDVSAFEIGGETEIAVLAPEDPESPAALFLGEIRGSACEHFHTVLGPGSDAAHWNHFHLDLAPRGRNGDSRFCQ